jgi:hypothetical protein
MMPVICAQQGVKPLDSWLRVGQQNQVRQTDGTVHGAMAPAEQVCDT